jgi:hypothetical protein
MMRLLIEVHAEPGTPETEDKAAALIRHWTHLDAARLGEQCVVITGRDDIEIEVLSVEIA